MKDLLIALRLNELSGIARAIAEPHRKHLATIFIRFQPIAMIKRLCGNIIVPYLNMNGEHFSSLALIEQGT